MCKKGISEHLAIGLMLLSMATGSVHAEIMECGRIGFGSGSESAYQALRNALPPGKKASPLLPIRVNELAALHEAVTNIYVQEKNANLLFQISGRMLGASGNSKHVVELTHQEGSWCLASGIETASDRGWGETTSFGTHFPF